MHVAFMCGYSVPVSAMSGRDTFGRTCSLVLQRIWRFNGSWVISFLIVIHQHYLLWCWL